jgi:hypothetical protein
LRQPRLNQERWDWSSRGRSRSSGDNVDALAGGFFAGDVSDFSGLGQRLMADSRSAMAAV